MRRKQVHLQRHVRPADAIYAHIEDEQGRQFVVWVGGAAILRGSGCYCCAHRLNRNLHRDWVLEQ